MKRLAVGIVTAALTVALFGPLPARAGGVWDPNEPIHRLDMRWVGAYMQADGKLRVTITFYDQVRLRWFDPPEFGVLSTLVVGFTEDRADRPFMYAIFARRSNRLIAAMCESGSNCGSGRVTRPNRFTIRAWFPSFDVSPRVGWSIRGRSTRQSGDLIALDRTTWGRVT